MPGGIGCSVATCKNNSKKAKETGTKLMFFSFPKNPNTRKEWEGKCYRYHKDKWSSDNKRICSNHFKPQDYEDEMQARLLNLPAKKLKKDAVPSLFLLPIEGDKQHQIYSSSRAKRSFKKEKTLVPKLLSTSRTAETSSTQMEVAKNDKDLYISNIPSNRKETSQEINDYKIFKRKFEALQNENLLLKQKIVEQENN